MQPEHALPLLGHTQLLEQVSLAFPPDPIRAAGAFDDWGTTYPDAEPYERQLDGKTWLELDRAYMEVREDALGFLGTRHLAAVLPVYLCSLIERGVWSPAAEMLMLLLTKPGPEKKTGVKLPRFEALVDTLTPAQREVIAVVLHAFAATNPGGSFEAAANTALERYWTTYLLHEIR